MTDTSTSHPHASPRRLVPLGALRLDHRLWANPRSFTGLDEDALDELAENIEQNGIQVPPHVVRVLANGSTTDLVIDGQRRVRAGLRVLDETTMIEVIDIEKEPIELTPQVAADLLRRALNIGENRRQLSSYELSEAAEKLRSQGLKLADIARAINRSETWVSKMLTARGAASAKLMLAWKKGEVTDEQFKDLAKVRNDDDEQETAVEEVVATRQAGDKAEARNKAKEIVETQKQEEAAEETKLKVVNGSNRPPVVAGPQEELFSDPKHRPSKAERPAAPPRVVLEDLVRLAEKKPPTHDYVKGILDGVKYALGFTSPQKFGNPWVTYLARLEGRSAPSPRRNKSAAKAKSGKTSGKAPPKTKQVLWQPFKVGDTVTWKSQAAGSWRTKKGRVLEVVAARQRPSTEIRGAGAPREHESYIVEIVHEVKKGARPKKPERFWPVVSVLKKAR